jgi:hypothetical protein
VGQNVVLRYLDGLSRGDPSALIGTGAFVILVLAALLFSRWRRDQKHRRWHE